MFRILLRIGDPNMNNSFSASLETTLHDITAAMAKSPAAIAESLLKTRPCVPQDAPPNIPKRAFDDWIIHIRAVVGSMTSLDGKGRYTVFRSAAGHQLLDLLSSLDIKDEVECSVNPFEEAVTRLTKYFSSSTNFVMARMTFRDCIQMPDESCVGYLTRLQKAAKECGFGKDSIETEVFLTIRTNARDSEIRRLVGGKDCSMEILRGKAADIDFDNVVVNRKKKSAAVNAVRDYPNRERSRSPPNHSPCDRSPRDRSPRSPRKPLPQPTK